MLDRRYPWPGFRIKIAALLCVLLLGAAATAHCGQTIPFFPSASDVWGRQGLTRLINHSDQAGQVTIEAIDDDGASYGPLTLFIDPGKTLHFDSIDLEDGNTHMGLTGGTGPGLGDWRLELASEFDIAVLSYIQTSDGFLAAMHDTAPWRDGAYRVAIFNPASDRYQESILRLVNIGKTTATATISGVDDAGASAAGAVTIEIPAGAAKTYSAAELESGSATGLEGSLGDGAGRWRLAVRSDQALIVMNLLSSSTGRLTNLSAIPNNETDGMHRVPYFLSVSDPLGRQGFARVINRSAVGGEVSIKAFDDTGREYEALALSLGPNEAKHFNSYDLEIGNVLKGLTGSTGAGTGDWRLELTSNLKLDVLAYFSTSDGFLAAMHDTVPRDGYSLLSSPTGQLTNRSSGSTDAVTHAFDFSLGEHGFVADFADYPPDDKEIYELMSDYRRLPSPLESSSALYISGVNRSDDLFMFYKKEIGGLVPGARYSVVVGATIATDTPAGCVGVGGAPGESVWIKAGASDIEPLPLLEGSYLRMNIDIGSQSNAGVNAVVLGNMANSRSCEQSSLWERKSFPAQTIPQPVTASPNGRAWLLLGVDSGFESRTEVYFTRVSATFTPLGPDTQRPGSEPIPLRWLPPRKDLPQVF